MIYTNILILNLLILILVFLLIKNYLLEKKIYNKFSYKLKILMKITFFVMLFGLVLSVILLDTIYYNENIYSNSNTIIFYTCFMICIYLILTFRQLINLNLKN